MVRSQLRVLRLDDTSTGTYWCKILAKGGEWLPPSDPLYLQQPAVYDTWPECSTSRAVSKEEIKCACLPQSSPIICPSSSIDDIMTSTLQPVQTSSFTAISQNQQDVVPLTAIMQSSDQRQTANLPSPTTRPYQSLTSSRIHASAMTLTTTMISQPVRQSFTTSLQPVATTSMEDNITESPNVESSDTPSYRNSNLLYELFISCSVLGLLAIVIVVLGFISIYLCTRRQHLKGKLVPSKRCCVEWHSPMIMHALHIVMFWYYTCSNHG